MNESNELAALFRRDITRLIQQLEAFSDNATLWQVSGGVTNPAGNLALHLEGNLRDFIGRVLGGIPYQRTRDNEFGGRDVTAAQMIERLTEVRDIVTQTLSSLNAETLNSTYPEKVMNGVYLSTRQFLLHLLAHLNYHLGQIDYARRMFTGNGSISYAAL